MLKDKIDQILNTQTLIAASDFAKEEIPGIYLHRLMQKNLLIKVGRGIYITDWSCYDEYAIFQKQHQKAIYSYLSALYFHGLVDTIPKYKEVTVYSGYNPHRFPKEIRPHFIKKDLFELGVSEVKTAFGNTVRVYDMERTICDLIAKRSEIETELFSKAIKRYTASPQKDFRKLYRYAKQLGISNKVREIMELIYE